MGHRLRVGAWLVGRGEGGGALLILQIMESGKRESGTYLEVSRGKERNTKWTGERIWRRAELVNKLLKANLQGEIWIRLVVDID